MLGATQEPDLIGRVSSSPVLDAEPIFAQIEVGLIMVLAWAHLVTAASRHLAPTHLFLICPSCGRISNKFARVPRSSTNSLQAFTGLINPASVRSGRASKVG